MKTLFFDCVMGAAGDMITASLLSLYDNPESKVEYLNSIGIPGVKYELSEKSINGIKGYHMNVTVNGIDESEISDSNNHIHSHFIDIENIINSLSIPQNVKDNSISIYTEIAKAESAVHGKPVNEVHFHEVGAIDAVADIVACCWLINDLNPEKIICSPICTGYGFVKCAHGTLPVPAPATSKLLEGIPVYSGDIEGELCTPTGAAVLRFFVDCFQKLPSIKITKTGFGFGKKEFKKPNCLRTIVGETENEVTELDFNVDDMTPEALAFSLDVFRRNGALDVSWESIGMKKNRPGFLIRVICSNEQRDKFVELIFKHTSTIGIREVLCSRYILKRKTEVLTTKWGPVHLKISEGYNTKKIKPEYEDIAKLAEENELSIAEIENEISKKE